MAAVLSAKTEDARAVLDAAGATWSEHFEARHAQLRGFIDESAGALSDQIEDFARRAVEAISDAGRGDPGRPSRGFASVSGPMERASRAGRRKIRRRRRRSRRLDRRQRRQHARRAGVDDRDIRRNARRARRRSGRRVDRPDREVGRATEFAGGLGGRRRRQRRRTDRRPRHASGRELRRPCRSHRRDHVQSSGRTQRPPDGSPRALRTSLERSPGGIRQARPPRIRPSSNSQRRRTPAPSTNSVRDGLATFATARRGTDLARQRGSQVADDADRRQAVVDRGSARRARPCPRRAARATQPGIGGAVRVRDAGRRAQRERETPGDRRVAGGLAGANRQRIGRARRQAVVDREALAARGRALDERLERRNQELAALFESEMQAAERSASAKLQEIAASLEGLLERIDSGLAARGDKLSSIEEAFVAHGRALDERLERRNQESAALFESEMQAAERSASAKLQEIAASLERLLEQIDSGLAARGKALNETLAKNTIEIARGIGGSVDRFRGQIVAPLQSLSTQFDAAIDSQGAAIHESIASARRRPGASLPLSGTRSPLGWRPQSRMWTRPWRVAAKTSPAISPRGSRSCARSWRARARPISSRNSACARAQISSQIASVSEHAARTFEQQTSSSHRLDDATRRGSARRDQRRRRHSVRSLGALTGQLSAEVETSTTALRAAAEVAQSQSSETINQLLSALTGTKSSNRARRSAKRSSATPARR